MRYIVAAALGAAIAVAGCAHLTAAEEGAILAADAAGCVALTLIPVVGPMLAAACPGEEALLKAALDKAVASSADAGAPVASAASALTVAPSTHKAVTRRHKGKRKLAGYVPAPMADAVQFHLDAADGMLPAGPAVLPDAGKDGAL